MHKMSRHALREHIFRILFSLEFHPEQTPEEMADVYLDETLEEEICDKDRFLIRSKVRELAEKLPSLDEEIDAVAEGWKIRHMGKAELNILRLALFEMRYDETVPVKVAINEAVELSKEYCNDDTPPFINGILARLVKEEAPAAVREPSGEPDEAKKPDEAKGPDAAKEQDA